MIKKHAFARMFLINNKTGGQRAMHFKAGQQPC